MRKFFLAFFHYKNRKVTGVEWRITNTAHNERNTSDMVQVSMSYKHCANLIFTFLKIGCIRNNIINSWCIFCLELHSSINNDNIIADFNCSHIFTDFLYSSEWNYSNDSFFWWGNG